MWRLIIRGSWSVSRKRCRPSPRQAMRSFRNLADLAVRWRNGGQQRLVILFAAVLATLAPGRSVSAQSAALGVDIGSRVRVTVSGTWIDLPRGVQAIRWCGESFERRSRSSSSAGLQCRTTLEGGLVVWNAEELVLSQHGLQIVLPPDRLQRLEVRRSHRTNGGKSALSGFVIGAALGGIVPCYLGSCHGTDTSRLLIFVPVGGLLGGMIGAIVGADDIHEWEVVAVPTLQVTTGSEFAFGLSVSLTPDWLP